MKHRMNVADVVTISRIIFAAFVLYCSVFSVQFYVFYLLGGISDMIDGRIARKRNQTSSFGAKLDTIADFIFITVVLTKILMVLDVPKWLWIWIAIIAFIKLANLILSLLISHRIVSMHTPMNKLTGFMLFLLPFAIGRELWQTLTIPVIVICATATFSAIQEGYFIRNRTKIKR